MNKTAVRYLGFTSNKSALGQILLMEELVDQNSDIKRGKIIGILKDFQITAPNHKQAPLILLNSDFLSKTAISRKKQNAIIRLKTGKDRGKLALLDQEWASIHQNRAPARRALAQIMKNQVKNEILFQKLAFLFAISLSILSLISLFAIIRAHFQLMMREINILHAFGKSMYKILCFCFKGFLKQIILLISTFIFPAYFIVQSWLKTYPSSYELSI